MEIFKLKDAVKLKEMIKLMRWWTWAKLTESKL